LMYPEQPVRCIPSQPLMLLFNVTGCAMIPVKAGMGTWHELVAVGALLVPAGS
jgi:hypothetical protein